MGKRYPLSVMLMLAVLTAGGAQAQKTVTLARDKIPHIPVDTLPVGRGGFLLVTFTDNTFEYIPADREAFADPAIYGCRWDTVNLFVYRDIELKDLPDRTELELMADSGGFRCPAQGRVISKYGPRGRRSHNGTDIKVAHGDPIYSAFDGIVRLSRWNSGGYGNIVVVRHTNGLETYYGHLSRRNVRAGDCVKAGQVIGYGGSTGRSNGTHLHFETRYCDQTFDPERLVDFENGCVRSRTFALEKGYFDIRSRAFEGPENAPGDADANLSDDTAVAEAVKNTAEYYKIRSGDNLGRIAIRQGTTVSEICRLNGISREATLRIGKTLRVR